MFILKLLIRNAFRHRLRTALTIVGVAVAITAFGLLRTLVDLWYAGVEASSSSRLLTRNAISLVFSLPISYEERIRQVPGVKDVSYGNWFGGIYKDEKNFFPSFAVEPKSYLAIYPEFVLPPDQERAFILDRRGCVVGRKTAERFGWKVGDQITLRGTIFPGEWDMVIRGIYHGARKNTDETQLFFHWDYLNEVVKKTVPRRADQVGIYFISLTKPELAAAVSLAVDRLFKNSLAETLTETEKAFQMSFVSMTEAIMVAIQIVSYVVIVIIMVVAANTMAMTARERIAEFATLKTLGFGAVHIAGVVFGESLVISLLGGILGIALTYPAAHWIESNLGQFFPVFSIAPLTIYLDLAAAATVGVVAGIFPTWRGATIRIADGLRRIG
ncbi:ABC transporter ATP-binding protein [Geotalea uraniireducens]|uniref:ABC transporter ATP-binding protein n=1 Tax=Geotalea uraniireducens TaxID=351604 RepID=A0ABN6VW99_9BACT|nr:FtsX-like permease family protein [Geotalea uraniireducens]BDV42480.1 ABC transporter ATP-binding protein [Geotalea uraniireducens]